MTIRSWTVMAVLAACAWSPASAQRVDPTRIIELHVNDEGNGQSFSGSVVEGRGFRMTFAGVGSFEIMPVLEDAAAERFRVTVFRGPEGAELGDMRPVETVSATVGTPVPLRSMPSVGLVIDGVRSIDRSAAAAQAAAQFAAAARPRIGGFQDSCCVVCAGVIACACAVRADCGKCCVEPCCSIILDPLSTDRFFPRARSFASLAGRCGEPVRDEERLFTPSSRRASIAMSR